MKQLNIVLVVMDTARAVDVGIRTGPATMPFLDGLAEQGTAFTDARANAPWTIPSHATLFSGQLTTDHGTHAGRLTFDIPEPLAERLAAAGYRTLGISNNTWVSPEFGFDTGFEEFISTWKLYQDGADFGGVSQTRSGIFDSLHGIAETWEGNALKNIANLLFGRFLRRRRDDGAHRTNQILRNRLQDDERPLFLFVNYLEPHLPYNPPDDYAHEWLPEDATIAEARQVNQDAWAYLTGEELMSDRDFQLLQALYRGELAYLDKRLFELHELVKSKLNRETVLFVVGDHGENIGDHGLMDHQYSLAETLLSVPLVAAGGTFEDGGRVETPVQLADIYPTVLDVATNNPPEGPVGQSLCRPSALDDERPLFGEYVTPQPSIQTLRNRYDPTVDLSQYNRALQAVRYGRYKLVRSSEGGSQLYDLRSDFPEKEDVSYRNPEVVRELDNLLDSRLGTPETTALDSREVDEEVHTRLEELGYLR